MKIRRYWIPVLVLCLSIVMTACRNGKEAAFVESRTETEQSQTKAKESQTEAKESRTEAKESRTETRKAIPGSYTVPGGWVEAKQYSTSQKMFYVKAGHEKDKKPDNISINVGKNRYSTDEQVEFREAVVRQLMAQLKGSGAELTGTGTYTKQGYSLYIFTIDEPGAKTKQYYIVDDYRFCLIHLTNYTGDKDSDEAAQAMADSFVWDK